MESIAFGPDQSVVVSVVGHESWSVQHPCRIISSHEQVLETAFYPCSVQSRVINPPTSQVRSVCLLWIRHWRGFCRARLSSQSVCLSVRLSVRLSVCCLVSQSVCPSIRPSVRPSVCQSVCLSVCLSASVSSKLYKTGKSNKTTKTVFKSLLTSVIYGRYMTDVFWQSMKMYNWTIEKQSEKFMIILQPHTNRKSIIQNNWQ